MTTISCYSAQTKLSVGESKRLIKILNGVKTDSPNYDVAVKVLDCLYQGTTDYTEERT